MSKQTIKATIDAQIKQNGQKAITGQVMNSVLKQMVDGLGAEDEVVHKEGDEYISGQKYFNGLVVSSEQTSISFSAESPFQERADQLVLEGEEGDANIKVQRDPMEDMELATRHYVDMGVLRVDQSTKIKAKFASLLEMSRKVSVLTALDEGNNQCTIIPVPGSLNGWLFTGDGGWRKAQSLAGFTLGDNTWWSELTGWMNNHSTPLG